MGLDKTGLSCARYLSHLNKPFVVMDTRKDPPELTEFKQAFPHCEVQLGELNKELLCKADELIVSPGISLQEPAIVQAMKQGVCAIGDIELFARAAKAPIVGITGTNAKGTVTTLVGEMICAAGYKVLVGGNIGIPALELLNQPLPDFYVLELSSFQLERTYSLNTLAATILNLSPDHLDRHGTMQDYAAAKHRVYKNCKTLVYNRDDAWTFPPHVASQKQISFGLDNSQTDQFGLMTIDRKTYLAFAHQPLLAVDELLIKGRHNWVNALSALALGYAINLPMAAMLAALKEFKGLPHRGEWVKEKAGVDWYNDSKGTNVGATIAAIEGLGGAIKGKIILIAGGLGKGQDFSLLRESVTHYVKQVLLIGKDAPLLAQVLQDIVEIHHATTLQNAVIAAKEIAQAGDAVLLSPACASMDMFKNFEERGDIFKQIVNDLH